MKFLNLNHLVSNLVTFIGHQYPNETITGINIKKLFIKSLIKFQGNNLTISNKINYSFGERKIGKIKEPYTKEFGRISPLDNSKRKIVIQKINEALQMIREEDERLFTLINLIVSDIVIVDGTGNNTAVTSSQIIGTIYMLPDPNWRVEMFAETIIHETIHLNIFLCDLINGLYVDNLKNEVALSSVRIGEQRPFDAAFHANCVVIAVMYFYSLLNQNKNFNKYFNPLKESVSDLKQKENLLSEYGKGILNEMNNFVLTKDFNSISESIMQ